VCAKPTESMMNARPEMEPPPRAVPCGGLAQATPRCVPGRAVSAAGQSVSQGLGSRAKPVGEEERRRRLTGRRARGGGGGTSREGRGRAGTRGRCGGARRATHRECRYQKPGNTPARIRSRKQGRPARCSCGHFKFTLVQNCSLRSDPIRGLEYGSRILRRVRVACHTAYRGVLQL
jgi:hypothetical protein